MTTLPDALSPLAPRTNNPTPRARFLSRAAALLLAGFALLSSFALADLAHPLAASAASKGAGLTNFTPYGGYLGNYIAPDGARVYCIDSALEWPAGATSGPEFIDHLTTTWGAPLSSEVLQKLNYVLLSYGETDDPVQAAAVAAYVNAYTSGWARDLGAGYAAGAWYLNGDPSVTAVYDQIWSDAEANAIPAPTASVSIEMADAATGVVRVAVSPEESVGMLRVDGALVADTGTTELEVSDGAVIPIVGTPADDAGSYSIGADASFSIATPAAPALILYATGDQQRTIRGGGPGEMTIAAAASTEAIPLDFSPVLTTTVSDAELEIGEAFVDRVTAAAADGSRPWRQRTDGSMLPVIAHGVLYGPFVEQPVLSAAVPQGAPVVGQQSLALAGPGEYSTDGSLVASAPGFYTWVWSIDAAAQDPATAASLPPGYTFASDFAIVEETHRVTAQLPELAQTGGSGSAGGSLGLAGFALLALGSALGIVARVVR